MTIGETAAVFYAILAVPPAFMQLALAAGAPFGEYTLGGRWPGKLPHAMRPVALLQACILITMATAVLDRSGVIELGWPAAAWWLAFAMTVLTCIANLATPSRPERRVWGPITVAMLVCVLAVWLTN